MDTKQETVLQAVVLADPFEHQSRYGPLIRGGGKDGEGCETAKPWASHFHFLKAAIDASRSTRDNILTVRAAQCLLPFCKAPLIAWTLESLAASNVKNTFIVIREGAQELQEWLECALVSSPPLRSIC